jgi:general secretion pathway protein H
MVSSAVRVKMPISATGIWKAELRSVLRGFGPGPQSGFTLLEILLVLALIGIITSFAVLSIGNNSVAEQLQTEARRLAALVELHRQEAIMLSRQRGLRLHTRGYSFLQLDGDDEWSVVDSPNLPYQHELAQPVEMNLVIEGRPLTLETDPGLPQILLLSSGETTDFSVTFASEYAEGYTLAADALGRLTLAPVR